jgi:hypothetical protein
MTKMVKKIELIRLERKLDVWYKYVVKKHPAILKNQNN